MPAHAPNECAQDAVVRLKAVGALVGLYQGTEHVPGLRGFKGRFLERLKELPYDVDQAVAVKGVRAVPHPPSPLLTCA